MPNKYYLRSDRTAVKPKKEEPELWHVYKDGRIGVLLPDEMASCMIFEDHILSLPALDVDPDYLKRLSPGWFEGEERREILTKAGWAEIGGDWYNRAKESHRRLTIIAPQEAENCNHPQNIKVGDYCPACDNDQTKQLIPATPQPVTGEEGLNERGRAMRVLRKHISWEDTTDGFIQYFAIAEITLEDGIIEAMKEYAASRPSDAVELAGKT